MSESYSQFIKFARRLARALNEHYSTRHQTVIDYRTRSSVEHDRDEKVKRSRMSVSRLPTIDKRMMSARDKTVRDRRNNRRPELK